MWAGSRECWVVADRPFAFRLNLMAHDVYTALSDPTRRRILSALSGGARPVGDLVVELEVSQPTVSKHLKVLRDVGLVSTRAEGQRRYYSVTPEPLAEAVAWIQDLLVERGQDEPVTSDTVETDAAPEQRAADVAVTEQPATDVAASGRAVPEPETHSQWRTMPWFRDERTVMAESSETTAGDSEKNFDISSAVPANAEIDGDRAIGDQAIAAVRETLHPEAPVAEVADITPGQEGHNTVFETADQGLSVVNDTDVSPAGESFYPSEATEREPLETDVGLPSTLGGVPYRKQGGLLSTLTGLRRRGKNSRR